LSISATRNRTEAIERGLRPSPGAVGRQFVYRSESKTARVSCAIEVAIIHRQAGLGLRAVGAASEAVKHLFGLSVGGASGHRQRREHRQRQSTAEYASCQLPRPQLGPNADS